MGPRLPCSNLRTLLYEFQFKLRSSRAYLVRIEGARSGVGSEQPAKGLSVVDRRTLDGRVEVFQVGLVPDVEESETEQGAGQERNDDERQRSTRDATAVPREYIAEEVLHVLVQRSHDFLLASRDVTVTDAANCDLTRQQWALHS